MQPVGPVLRRADDYATGPRPDSVRDIYMLEVLLIRHFKFSAGRVDIGSARIHVVPMLFNLNVASSLKIAAVCRGGRRSACTQQNLD